MARVTFQVVEGLEAGRVFSDVATPLTIGREEDNDIQLNDERISRFHVKVQDDNGRLILTDLDSTNGTRVNGHPVRLRVLRTGDLIMVGRCVLLVGGPEELDRLTARLKAREEIDQESDTPSAAPVPSDLVEAFPLGPPDLPAELTPRQIVELNDVLEFIRTELLAALMTPVTELHTDDKQAYVRVPEAAWRVIESLAPEISRLQNRLSGNEAE